MKIDYNQLIHSITYYLSYQDKIGRSFMINESFLKYPVADYLTGLEVPLTQIQIEYPHPNLKKRLIDLIITDRSKNNIASAFEFKISRSDTKYEPQQKRIFNDLMRLYLLAKSGNSFCYFIIAGTQTDFIQSFRNISRPSKIKSKDVPEPQGFYTEWFDFRPNQSKIFDVQAAPDGSYLKIYNSFLANYKSKSRDNISALPATITTTCLAISALSKEYPTPFVGGIWKVE